MRRLSSLWHGTNYAVIYAVRCFTGHFLQIHDRRILFYIIYSLDMTTIINEHIFSVFR